MTFIALSWMSRNLRVCELAPQPLDKVRRLADFSYGTECLARHPELAAIVAQVINSWSIVDSNLGHTLALMIGSRPQPAVAMYLSMKNFSAQVLALNAAAEQAFEDHDNYLLFRSTLEFIRKKKKIRDKFAHWMWGSVSGFEDALLLLDPKVSISASAMVRDTLPASRQGRIDADKKIREKSMVYRKVDLQDALNDAESIVGISSTLSGFADPSGYFRSTLGVELLKNHEIKNNFNKFKGR